MCSETTDTKLRLYRFAFENARDATIAVDAEGRALVTNRAARALPDGLFDHLFGTNRSRASELEQFRRELAGGAHPRAEIGVGDRTWVLEGRAHHAMRAVGLVTVRDLTEQRALEDELRSLRRVESLGHLTASLAHDFNNLLTPIVSLSTALEAELRPGTAGQAMARDIAAAAQRAAALARQTMARVRRTPARVEPVSVNAVVAELRALIERVAGAEVAVELALETGDTGGVTAVERERLESAILNLVANARDAIRDARAHADRVDGADGNPDADPTGGKLTLRTSRVTFDAVEASAIEGATARGYVCLQVTDNGTGMTRSVRERIFERFFTTKEVGRGTGLGLGAVRRFVAESGGCIAVHSEPYRGTTVVLYLPLVDVPGREPPDAAALE